MHWAWRPSLLEGQPSRTSPPSRLDVLQPGGLQGSRASSLGGSAAAEPGQQAGQAEQEPQQQQVGAEGQQGQRVQQAGLQPEVPHRQHTAQVLLEQPLPRPSAGGRDGEVGGWVGGGGRREGPDA